MTPYIQQMTAAMILPQAAMAESAARIAAFWATQTRTMLARMPLGADAAEDAFETGIDRARDGVETAARIAEDGSGEPAATGFHAFERTVDAVAGDAAPTR